MNNAHLHHQLIQQFFDLSKPCNFPGCKQLRERFKAEKNRGSCSGCQTAALTRKYKDIIKNRLQTQ